jgi:hypothetical protein
MHHLPLVHPLLRQLLALRRLHLLLQRRRLLLLRQRQGQLTLHTSWLHSILRLQLRLKALPGDWRRRLCRWCRFVGRQQHLLQHDSDALPCLGRNRQVAHDLVHIQPACLDIPAHLAQRLRRRRRQQEEGRAAGC